MKKNYIRKWSTALRSRKVLFFKSLLSIVPPCPRYSLLLTKMEYGKQNSFNNFLKDFEKVKIMILNVFLIFKKIGWFLFRSDRIDSWIKNILRRYFHWIKCQIFYATIWAFWLGPQWVGLLGLRCADKLMWNLNYIIFGIFDIWEMYLSFHLERGILRAWASDFSHGPVFIGPRSY